MLKEKMADRVGFGAAREGGQAGPVDLRKRRTHGAPATGRQSHDVMLKEKNGGQGGVRRGPRRRASRSSGPAKAANAWSASDGPAIPRRDAEGKKWRTGWGSARPAKAGEQVQWTCESGER